MCLKRNMISLRKLCLNQLAKEEKNYTEELPHSLRRDYHHSMNIQTTRYERIFIGCNGLVIFYSDTSDPLMTEEGFYPLTIGDINTFILYKVWFDEYISHLKVRDRTPLSIIKMVDREFSRLRMNKSQKEVIERLIDGRQVFIIAFLDSSHLKVRDSGEWLKIGMDHARRTIQQEVIDNLNRRCFYFYVSCLCFYCRSDFPERCYKKIYDWKKRHEICS